MLSMPPILQFGQYLEEKQYQNCGNLVKHERLDIEGGAQRLEDQTHRIDVG
jgi:hypothetical protein